MLDWLRVPWSRLPCSSGCWTATPSLPQSQRSASGMTAALRFTVHRSELPEPWNSSTSPAQMQTSHKESEFGHFAHLQPFSQSFFLSFLSVSLFSSFSVLWMVEMVLSNLPNCKLNVWNAARYFDPIPEKKINLLLSMFGKAELPSKITHPYYCHLNKSLPHHTYPQPPVPPQSYSQQAETQNTEVGCFLHFHQAHQLTDRD